MHIFHRWGKWVEVEHIVSFPWAPRSQTSCLYQRRICSKCGLINEKRI